MYLDPRGWVIAGNGESQKIEDWMSEKSEILGPDSI